MENKEFKDYREERFEFTIYVNDNIICKRNFKIFNFIEGSMNTLEFKETVDKIVNIIDNDLKSKSRVYTWYYFNPNDIIEGDEFDSPLIDPWVCTFKIVISDNKKDVITKIWDGYAYPKAIREKVDLGNKNVKFLTKEGEVVTYDKETFFSMNKGRLSFENEVLRGMIMDKPDVLLQITKTICEACSVSKDEIKENGFFDFKDNAKYLSQYTTIGEYRNTEAVRDENGDIVSFKQVGKAKKYPYSLTLSNNRVESEWGKAVAEKTKKYLKTLY